MDPKIKRPIWRAGHFSHAVLANYTTRNLAKQFARHLREGIINGNIFLFYHYPYGNIVRQPVESNLLASTDTKHIKSFKGHVTIVTENGVDANWLAVTISITVQKIDTDPRAKQSGITNRIRPMIQ